MFPRVLSEERKGSPGKVPELAFLSSTSTHNKFGGSAALGCLGLGRPPALHVGTLQRGPIQTLMTGFLWIEDGAFIES
jgi:hypothetical protein